MEAQANMRSASVLLVNLGALGDEITKNLVLSGIGSLTILDSHEVTEDDLGAQFFVGKGDIGTKRLEAARKHIEDMNPRVKLDVDTSDFGSKDEAWFSQFNLIVATDLAPRQIRKLNNLTRKLKIPLYASAINGLSGYAFVDLIEFVSTDEKAMSAKPEQVGRHSPNKEIIEVGERRDDEKNTVFQIIKTKHIYKPFDTLLKDAVLTNQLSKRQLKRMSSRAPLTLTLLQYDSYDSIDPQEFMKRYDLTCKQLGLMIDDIDMTTIKQFLAQAGVEISPVASIIAGSVSQDIINILGKRQSPLNNFVVFDGVTLDMWVFEL